VMLVEDAWRRRRRRPGALPIGMPVNAGLLWGFSHKSWGYHSSAALAKALWLESFSCVRHVVRLQINIKSPYFVSNP
jgi:hypothetical protein